MNKALLVYGFGNIGRQDDGLGVLCAEQIQQTNIKEVKVETNFQLNAEDALLLTETDTVVFVDASTAIDSAYALLPIQPDPAITFSTHAMTPQSVLSFCDEIYQHKPTAYVLHIQGYEWEFGLPVSNKAHENLQLAVAFLINWINTNHSNS